MRKLDSCYHSHTTRCGHAYGTDEEYVLASMNAHFKVIGFSDHIFFPGVSQPGMRGDFSQLDDYKKSVLSLKKKYQNEIKIHLGFEAEYYPHFDAYYRDLFLKHGFEYLILGHHFRYENGRFPVYYAMGKSPSIIKEYAQGIVAALKTGLFSYVAHPDLYMTGYVGGWDVHAIQVAHTICQAAKETNTPLELNLGGINGRGMMSIAGELRYPYPYPAFWAIAKQYDVEVIIGLDAHAPSQYSGNNWQILYDIVDRYNLKLIDRLSFKQLKEEK
jgi:histidinol-phosphatase (PHP family)